MGATSESPYIQRVCVPLLEWAQSEDGGWGFRPRSQSRVEPTCWALFALLNSSSSPKTEKIIAGGFQFLHSAQLPNGSWPSWPGDEAGSWVTALACWVLLLERGSSEAVAAGLKWLCEDWPRDSSPWMRLLRRLSPGRDVSPHNDSYRGWGWTPRTSSWVEPTSFALITLSLSPSELLPNNARRRQELAEALLHDRMCPGGGWNCGNPMIYGVPGDPLVIPTVWALLALRDSSGRRENTLSLDWLMKSLEKIQGPGSLALARICIEDYGQTSPRGAQHLSDLYQKNEFLQNIPVIAWTCLACSAREHWLTKSPSEKSR
jgi:hypothetical protein